MYIIEISKGMGVETMPRKAKKPVEVKTRKQYPDRATRIAMADEKIQRLEKLNEERRQLIAKTEAKLNDRKESLTKSEAELEKVKARRERMIAMQDRPAASESRKARSAEKAELEKLRALLFCVTRLDRLIVFLPSVTERAVEKVLAKMHR